MLEKPMQELKDYVRADYARDIARSNSHKPLEERWRLIVASEEHQRRRLFARTRAKFILLASFPLIAAFLFFQFMAGTDTPAPDVEDIVVIGALAAYAIVAIAVAWRLGNKAADREWSARNTGKTTEIR